MSMSSVDREHRVARRSGSTGLLAAAMAGVLSVAAVSASHAATFAVWGATNHTASTLSISGTLGGTSLTMDVTGFGQFDTMGSTTSNLSNTTNYVQPGSASQSVVNFPQDNSATPGTTTTTITFVTAVSDLGLYMRFWRGGLYTLTATDASSNSVSYSFLSGNYPSTPSVTSNQFSLTNNFTDGIIAFSGAVKQVTFSYNNTSGLPGSSQLTLGILATPVPGGGVAVALGVAAAAARRRRR